MCQAKDQLDAVQPPGTDNYQDYNPAAVCPVCGKLLAGHTSLEVGDCLVEAQKEMVSRSYSPTITRAVKKSENYTIYVGVINENGTILEETPYFMDGLVAAWSSQEEALDALHGLADTRKGDNNGP